MANHVFRGVHDTLLNVFGSDRIEWFYIDRSNQYYNAVYDEYISRNENEALLLIKAGNLRGLCINDPAKILAKYAEGGTGENAEQYPFSLLSHTVMFKCSATDCAKLGILTAQDTFEYEDIQERGENTGVVEGILNHKYIRYQGQWYRVVDVLRENVVKNESAKITFTAEMPSISIENELESQYLEIVDDIESYEVYIDNEEYGEFDSGSVVTLPNQSREGYEFAGYTSNDVSISNNQFTMPDNDVYVTTNWTQKYGVTVDGVLIGSYVAGTVVQIDAGTRENYTFDRWVGFSVNDEYSAQTYFTMPSENVTLETTWERVTSSWNVYIDNVSIGTYEEGDSVNISAGVRENYTFDYWSGNVNVGDAYSSNTFFAMIDEPVYLVTHWQPNFWTIDLSSSYGYDDTYTVTKGNSFTLQHGTHSQANYAFDHWTVTSGTYTGNLDSAFYPTSNMEIAGEWVKLGDYSVTYSGVSKSTTYHYEGDTVLLSAPNKDNYDFGNWEVTYTELGRKYYVSLNSSVTNPNNSFTMPAYNCTAKATYYEWEYEVTFMVDNEVYYVQGVSFSGKINPPVEPTKEGYTFQYWKYGNQQANFNDEITEDRTYTAYFTQNIVYKTVTLYNDGTVYDTIQVESGTTLSTAISTIPTPTYTVYQRFNGWLNSITSAQLTLDTVINDDVSYVANYTTLYSVSISGMTYTTTYHAVGETVNISAESKTGKTFNEWQSNQVTFNNAQSSNTYFTMIAQNVEITATYNDIYYTVTFYSDGAEYDEVTVIYGGTVNRPSTDPTKQYHTFNGWVDSLGNTVNFNQEIYEDKSYYADFTHIAYTMTYMVDTTVYTTQSVLAGNSITTFPNDPPVPQTYSTTYEFKYWTYNGAEIDETYVPVSNMTLQAYFDEIVTSAEIASINLNSTRDVVYTRQVITIYISATIYTNLEYVGGNMSNLTSGTNFTMSNDREWYKLPMYVSSTHPNAYTHKDKVLGNRGIKYAGFPFDIRIEEDDYFTGSSWADILANEHISTAFVFSGNYSTRINANTNKANASYQSSINLSDAVMVTYSRWHYDPYDEDLAKAPRPPKILSCVYQSSTGKYKVTLEVSLLEKDQSTTSVTLYTYCRDVIDLGNGWYRYEWFQDTGYFYSTYQGIMQQQTGETLEVLSSTP